MESMPCTFSSGVCSALMRGTKFLSGTLKLLAGVLSLVACGAQHPSPAVAGSSQSKPMVRDATKGNSTPSEPPKPGGAAVRTVPKLPRLAIRFRPDGDRRVLDVELSLAGHSAQRLSLSDARRTQLETVSARDEGGPLTVDLVERDGALHLVLNRPSRGELHVRYRLPAASDVDSTKILATAVDPSRMRVVGERVLALPLGLDAKPIEVTLSIDPSEVRGAGAASSFGRGTEQSFRSSGEALRHGSYIAGEIGTAVFRSPWASDTSIYLGQFGFAPRQIAADMAVFRSAVGRILGYRDPMPMTLVWMTDARPPGQFLVTARSRGALIALSAGESWSVGLRVAVATAITQRWIGSRLWIEPAAAEKEVEHYWFSEGVARWFAATALLHSGLLSLNDYAEEVNGLIAVTVTAKERKLDQPALSERYGKKRQGLPLMVARGALYALELDAHLRAKKTSSLAEVLAKLIRVQNRDRGGVPIAQWHRAVDQPGMETSSAARYAGQIRQGEAVRPYARSLGSCFRRTMGQYDVFALGFDAEATSRAKSHQPVSFDPKGPAARAGLRADDEVEFVRYRRGYTDVDVRIAVRRGDKRIQLRYRPVGERLRGPRFVRHGKLRDHQCEW